MELFSQIDIELAYDKLCNYYYYEKIDLITRKKVFAWNRGKIKSLTNELNDTNNDFVKYFNQINLNPYPKSFKEESKRNIEGYFSNRTILQNDSITNFLVFIDAPVELHIISILWTIKLGIILDNQLDINCYGNRIYSNQYKPKQLFEKYHRNYKLWWSNALESTKKLISTKQNATIFSFDIKSYYHSVEIDFTLLEKTFSKELITFSNKRVFDLLKKIHIYYKSKIYNVYPSLVTNKEERYPLPIGLLSSFVIANYYLLELDKELKLTKPIYYGRYVDDIILVYKGINRLKKENYINSFIAINFSKVLKIIPNTEGSEIRFKNIKYNNLQIQKEKVNLYEFSYKNSPSILSVLVEDQRKKSSEFRFLSDILDDNFDDFEGIIFEGNFDFEEGNKAKFKDVNENKFKIASFLSKLTTRVIDHGDNYKSTEIEKVFKFFKGRYLLQHYYFWEKILTLYWVSGNIKYFNKTVLSIKESINNLKIESDWDIEQTHLKKTLNNYLAIAVDLSQILNPPKTFDIISKVENKTVPRDHYSIYPFLPYTKAFLNNQINLLDHNCLNEFKSNPEAIKVIPSLVPIGKPFYWCYLATYFFHVFAETIIDINQIKLLDESYKLYKEINRCDIEKDEIFEIVKIRDNKNKLKELYEITSKYNSDKLNNNCRTAIVNQIVSKENFISSLNSIPIKSTKREEEIRFELDQISKIPKLDIVVKPELAIPIFSIFNYVQHSAKFQYSLNSGIEYIPSNRYANNFILCTLPIKIGGVFSDCIPIIRLKNDYSYEEKNEIENRPNLSIPIKKKQEFYLFRSKGAYFSNYYCFELTSIENRALFKSMVDLIVAPVWNKDNFYFKAISETLVRDIHCFYAQSNTSEFADSRMIQPTKSIFLVKSLVKGGTITEPRFNFSFLIDDLNLKKIRDFQLMTYESTQEVKFKKYNIYKPIPPDFNRNNVIKRINNLSMNNDFFDDTNK